jgi:hypothetical protein
MKKIASIVLLLLIAMNIFVSCKNADREYSASDEDSQGLEFYPRDDGTYAVALGDKSRFLTNITLPETHRGKPVVEFTHNRDQVDFSNSANFCFNLLSLTIPESIVNINVNALGNCWKLVEVINHSQSDFSFLTEVFFDNWHQILELHNGDSKIKTVNGFHFLTSGGTNYLLGYSGNDSEIKLPKDYNGEKYQIHDYAFYNNLGFKSIRISKNVSAIGMNIIDIYPSMIIGFDAFYYEGTEEDFQKVSGKENIEGLGVRYDSNVASHE